VGGGGGGHLLATQFHPHLLKLATEVKRVVLKWVITEGQYPEHQASRPTRLYCTVPCCIFCKSSSDLGEFCTGFSKFLFSCGYICFLLIFSFVRENIGSRVSF
jgi:hypothetical protein